MLERVTAPFFGSPRAPSQLPWNGTRVFQYLPLVPSCKLLTKLDLVQPVIVHDRHRLYRYYGSDTNIDELSASISLRLYMPIKLVLG